MQAQKSMTRIVILDDDASLTLVVAMMARETLDTNEVRIDTITSVQAAEAVIAELAQDAATRSVFLSDYHLPPSTRTGLHLLEEVRARLPRAKRVLMTGRERSDLEPEITLAELDGFLSKPFSFPEFAILLERLVREAQVGRSIPIEPETSPQTSRQLTRDT